MNLLKQITTIGADTLENEYSKKNLRLFNTIIVLVGLSIICYSPLFFVFGSIILIPVTMLFIFCFFVCLYLNHSGFFRFSRLVFLSCCQIMILYYGIQLGEGEGHIALYLCTAAFIIILFNSLKTILWLEVLNILFVIGLAIAQEYIPASHHINNQIITDYKIGNYVISAFTVLLLFGLYKFNNFKFEKALAAKNAIIAGINYELIGSMEYAEKIQKTILPDEKTFKSSFPESFVLYKPKEHVSGDFYWIAKSDHSVLIAAADCTGHGVPGAFLSIIGHTALNKCVNQYNLTEPGAILDVLNAIVNETLKKGNESDFVVDGMDISLCSIDLLSNNIAYAGANLPIYIIRNGELTEERANKQPIGSTVYKKYASFDTKELKFEHGDMLYMFSDGFADQFGGAQNRKLMRTGFKTLLIHASNLPITEQQDFVNNALLDWQGDVPQVDDICLLGIRLTNQS